MKTIQTAPVYRDAALTRAEEEGTYRLAFSSEAPVVRTFPVENELRRGNEILSHREGHVDLAFFASGRAPLLLDHDTREVVGVIRSATLDADGVVRGDVAFSRGPRGEEIRGDVDDGIRTNVSIGYEIREIEHERSEDGLDTFRVVDWRPFEGSLVSIPADTSVGVGRNQEASVSTVVRSVSMSDTPAPESTPAVEPSAEPVVALNENDLAKMRAEAAEKEHARVEEIQTYGRRFQRQDLAEKAVRAGLSVEKFRYDLLQSIPEHTMVGADSTLGLTERERRSYSLMNVINLRAAKTTDEIRKAEEKAAFELEVSRAYAQKRGKDPRGTWVPLEAVSKRVLDTQVASTGDHLVGTDHLAAEFIESLENNAPTIGLGARTMMGLEGNVEIPRRTAGSTAAWLAAEDDQAAESDSAFDEITMSPKDLAYYTDMTRRLRQQSSPDIEALVRSDISRAMANGLDQAIINGGGATGVPQGIIGATGVGSADLSTLNHDALLLMEEQVLAANGAGAGNYAFLGSARAVRRLSGTEKATNTGQFLMDRSGVLGDGPVKGSVIAYPMAQTQNIPDTLAPGTNSALIFGSWSQVLVGMWGGLDITADPYSEARRNRLRIIVFMTADIQIRLPQLFSVAVNLAA